MTDFAPPLHKLGDSGIGVAAAPSGGMGLALTADGKLPASVLPSLLTTWPTGTPDAGQEFVYKATVGDGEVYWHFKYDPTQTTYKWLCVGGAAAYADVLTDESTASTAYANLTTTGPTITLPRAGDYQIRYGAEIYNNGVGNIGLVSTSVSGAAASDNNAARDRANAATTLQQAAWREGTGLSFTANDTIQLKYRVSGGTGNFRNRRLTVLPIRVS